MFCFPQPDLTRSEHLALWYLRRAAGAPAVCSKMNGAGANHGELTRLAAMIGAAQTAIRFAPPASLLLTKDERRLLRALAAVQAENGDLADQYLYRFALDAGKRGRLYAAVNDLAAWLAVKGFWLPAG